MAGAAAPGTTTGKSGMATFTAVAVGQVVSFLGSGMVGFALVIWAYLETGQVTTLALASLFRFAPTVLFSPTAGALVDRWNRKLTMMLSDLASGSATIALLLLYTFSDLQVWQWFVAGAFAGFFEAFQFPAFSAAISTMIPKAQYGRASGMLSLAQSASGVFSPVVAAAILGTLGLMLALPVIMLIDIATFTVATGILLAIRIPEPPRTEEGMRARGSLMKESAFGFRYIAERPSLLGLQLVFFSMNFLFTLGFIVLPAMILSRTNNDAFALGSVQSVGAIGAVIGSVVMSAWGGPKRRVHGVLGGMAIAGLGSVLMGVGQVFYVWAAASFFDFFLVPIINGSNQAIWQSKVSPDIQGRVFAVRRLIAQITAPLAMAIAGPLADFVFEPAMQPGAALASVFGWLVGVGPGAGIGLMLVVFGITGTAVGLAFYGVRVVRDAETILPDFDAKAVAASDPGR